ncbi:MAG: DUF4922 domain-containing protein [Bacteroidaceae bacterium]|nr:DUF4922 domain-containing protein [Bacteroidaceae bacterium]
MWSDARMKYGQLNQVLTKELAVDNCLIGVQYNPVRMVSTGARVDAKTIRRRSCFLCETNRPADQMSMPFMGRYHLLLNPNPILPKHFTIPLRHHCRQQIQGHYEDLMAMVAKLDDLMFFYNGPLCGASAPDHLHFQAGSRGVVPLERDWKQVYRPQMMCLRSGDCNGMGVYQLNGYLCVGFVIVAPTSETHQTLFNSVYSSLPVPAGGYEPMMNILAWADNEDGLVSVVLPRAKHRPDCYHAEGEAQTLVSPGALDMGGLLITPREEDFNKVDAQLAKTIIQECGMTENQVI